VGRYIIIFLLFALPLVFHPLGNLAYEQPKVFVAQIAIELLVVFAIYKFELFKNFSKHLLYIVGGFLLLSLTSFLTPIDDSFFGNIFRLQGVFLFWHLLVFALLSSKIDFKVNRYIPHLSLIVLMVSALVMESNHAGRAVGTLGEPNALAAAAIFVFPFAFMSGTRKNLVILERTLVIGLTLGILYLSESHSGIIAFGIEILYFLMLYSKRISKQSALIVCCLVITLSLVLPFIEEKRVYEDRAEIWYTSLVAGLKNPFFGNGFGTTEEAIHQASINLYNFVRLQKVDSAHNFLLDYWIQGGILGVGLMLLLLYDTFRNLVRKSDIQIVMAFLGIVTVMLFNPVSVVTLIAFWWLVGYSFSKNPSDL